MSVVPSFFVSGVTLMTALADEPSDSHRTTDCPDNWGAVNQWLAEHHHGSLVMLDEHYGGNKHPQCHVGGGGFNYLSEDDFAAFVMSLPWERPDNVVLVIQPEEGRTRVFRPGDIVAIELIRCDGPGCDRTRSEGSGGEWIIEVWRNMSRGECCEFNYCPTCAISNRRSAPKSGSTTVKR